MVRLSSILFIVLPIAAIAAIPTTVVPTQSGSANSAVPATAPESLPSENSAAIAPSAPVGGVVTEIKAQRSPVPDFDGDLNNLAAGESRYREDGNRQAKLKSAIKGATKGNVARK